MLPERAPREAQGQVGPRQEGITAQIQNIVLATMCMGFTFMGVLEGDPIPLNRLLDSLKREDPEMPGEEIPWDQ